jgi:hypothetical protein
MARRVPDGRSSSFAASVAIVLSGWLVMQLDVGIATTLGHRSPADALGARAGTT